MLTGKQASKDDDGRRSNVIIAVLATACVCCACLALALGIGWLIWAIVHPVSVTPVPVKVIKVRCFDNNTYFVDNLNDSGTGSLRWAIGQANLHPGADCIRFECPHKAPNVIFLLTPLPAITDALDIDGWCDNDRVCLEGSTMNGTNCYADGVRDGFCSGALGTAFLEIGDRLFATTNVGLNTVVRRLRFSNTNLTNINVQPQADIVGPCVGVAIYQTSNVSVRDCYFNGFVHRMPAVLVRTSFFVDVSRNYFDSVVHAVGMCDSVWCRASRNNATT